MCTVNTWLDLCCTHWPEMSHAGEEGGFLFDTDTISGCVLPANTKRDRAGRWLLLLTVPVDSTPFSPPAPTVALNRKLSGLLGASYTHVPTVAYCCTVEARSNVTLIAVEAVESRDVKLMTQRIALSCTRIHE